MRISLPRQLLRRAAALLAFGSTAAMLALQPLPGRAQPIESDFGATAAQTLNYRDADMRTFIEDVSMLTGRIFIVGPRVQGKVTVISDAPVDPPAVFQIFLSTLQAYGYTAVPTASGAYKIVEDADAAQQAQPVGAEGVAGDRFVTEVFLLDHVDPQAAMRALQPLVSPDGRAIAQPESDFLIVVDYAANMARVRDLVARIDRDRSVTRTLALKHISAQEMAGIVEGLVGAGGGNRRQAREGALTVIPVDASNTLVLRGKSEIIDSLLPTIREIDAKSAARGSLRVFYLKHAAADRMVPLLQDISRTIGSVAGEGGGGPSRASIALHEETNSLVVSAEPDMMQALEQVINQLDIRRAQVLVEAIIVEITDDAARELGLQYVLAGAEGSSIPFAATNFGNTAPNILAATGAVVADQETSGESDIVDTLQEAAVNSLLGISGFLSGGAVRFDDGTLFGIILTALAQKTGSNVLSTPSILTLDNEAASILVGQEIPITTGEVLGDDLTNPFRTVDRQDVGIQLDVRPQVNDGDLVKLFIRQEVSSVLGPVSVGSQELVLNKREIETTVTVDDGEIVILGGLIEDDEQISVQKVPYLGDIPVLGRLFRSEAKSQVKTNLMVFLRPTILRDAQDARSVTRRKYNYIRAEQVIRAGDGEPELDSYLRDVVGRGAPLSLPATENPDTRDRQR